MDFGDPRESVISLNTPATWEADNRVEERWQWGAQLLDLCDLSPEEYKNSTAVTVKTIQDCGECGGGGGETVKENVGKAAISDAGEFSISFESAVASPLYAFVTFKDSTGTEYTFSTLVSKGSKSATYDITDLSSDSPYAITDIKLGFKEDGSDADETVQDKKYEYETEYEGDIEGKTFVMSILCTKTDNLTGEDYADIISSQGSGFDYVASYDEITFGDTDTAQAIFYAPCSFIDHYMKEKEEREYFAENSFDFVILTENTVLEIKEDFTTDTENWEESAITVDGKNFNMWLRRDLTGAQCPYSVNDNTCEDYELTYTLKIKE